MKKSYADMDPLEEIRAIREEISREFTSLRDLGAYLREKTASVHTQAKPSRKIRGTTKPVIRQRKYAKHLTSV